MFAGNAQYINALRQMTRRLHRYTGSCRGKLCSLLMYDVTRSIYQLQLDTARVPRQ